jgi:hypothetical protein
MLLQVLLGCLSKRPCGPDSVDGLLADLFESSREIALCLREITCSTAFNIGFDVDGGPRMRPHLRRTFVPFSIGSLEYVTGAQFNIDGGIHAGSTVAPGANAAAP